MTHRTRIFRNLEILELRVNPAGGLPSEGFEAVAPPTLPTGWNFWSNDGQQEFITTKLHAATGTNALASLGSISVGARFWSQSTVSSDVGFAANVYSSTPAPIQVITRGVGLSTSTPSFVAAVVRNGGVIQLVEVTNGVSTTLGQVTPSKYLTSTWLRVTVQPTGNSVSVTVQRNDTGQYLNAQGNWQTGSVSVLQGNVVGNPTTSLVGIGRGSGEGGGMAYVDDLTTIAAPVSPPPASPPPPVSPPTSPTPPTISSLNESFDTTSSGALPAGWQSWASDGLPHMTVSTGASVSPSNALAASGTSAVQTQAWVTGVSSADAVVSADVYSDSLIPAGVIVRGQNLNSATPTYYDLTVTRGLTVQINAVVNGTVTNLASLNSTAWTYGTWVRLTLNVQGNSLAAVVYRLDTQQWLQADGTWSSVPDQAIAITDNTISGAGTVGLVRSRSYAGTVRFDDFSFQPPGASDGPTVTVSPSNAGPTISLTNTITATTTPGAAGASVLRLDYSVDGILAASFNSSSAVWQWDTTQYTNGTHTLSVRAVDANGNVGTTTMTFNVSNTAGSSKPPLPTAPQHYSFIRLAQLAYDGSTMSASELALAKNSVDLIITTPKYLADFTAVAPNSPKLLYTNVSNLYGNLLTSWNAYADANGVSRETAYYHVTQPTAFTGNSPSATPVNEFWNVSTVSGSSIRDYTGAAYGSWGNGVPASATTGSSVVIGYPEPFAEVNIVLSTPASSGWTGVFQYVSAVDANGNATAWKTLKLKSDGTNRLTTNGSLSFDPPADWVAANQPGGTQRLMQIRLLTTSNTSTGAPFFKTILANDYVNAKGTDTGTIPVFDSAADVDHDGYLNDAEWANRKAGSDARFVYQSRLFYPYYGQMRFALNPSSTAVQNWAASYNQQLLTANPLATGLFIDNSGGSLPFAGTPVQESVVSYTADMAKMVGAVTRQVSPNWTIVNTAGSTSTGNTITANASGAFEEFLLRPNSVNWSGFQDVANLVASRLAATSPSPYLIIDSYPDSQSASDPTTQSSILAYYYLLASPTKTFLMFSGGYSPTAQWSSVIPNAATVDVGQPLGAMSLFATGLDPQNTKLTYNVYGRQYSNALMLFKPLSYASGQAPGTTSSATATLIPLGGNYRVLNADGTLGPVITSISLRNGQGVTLMKA